jgi:hypothetical protein
MTTRTPSHPISDDVVASRVAPTEEGYTWTPTDRLIGIWVAWSVFGLGVIYVAVMALGFIAAGGLDAPLGDPAFAIMELLILVQAPLIVLLFGAFHRYAAPRCRSLSLAAFALVVVMAGITLSVHFVLLTVGRQVPSTLLPGFDRLFSFNWPSVAYALDILAWDYCFGLALLAAAPVFARGRAERVVSTGLMLAGVLCLVGLLGVVTANMQIRNVGIVGYGVVFPLVTLLIARLFERERLEGSTKDRAGIGA